MWTLIGYVVTGLLALLGLSSMIHFEESPAFIQRMCKRYPKLDERLSRIKKFRHNPWACGGFILLLAILDGTSKYVSDCETEKFQGQITEQLHRIEIKKGQIDSQSSKIEFLTNQVATLTNTTAQQLRRIEDLNGLVIDQSRQIGALVYNNKTTFEGKLRFLKCFENLSSISSHHYEPLLCEDGVAVFRFTKDETQLTGFNFFENSDVNAVLTGDPMHHDVGATGGTLILSADSEVAKVLKKYEDEKTPSWSDSPIVRKRALREMAELVKTFCRYVFRGNEPEVKTSFYESNGKRGADARWSGWSVSFWYEVDPFAEKPCRRHITDYMSADFVKSLYGVSKETFASRLITHFSRRGIHPKVQAKDISSLNAKTLHTVREKAFPYRKQGVEP